MRYEQEAAESGVAGLEVGTTGAVRGTLAAARWAGGGRGRGRFEATREDEAGETLRATWFNAGWLRDKLHPGMTVRLRGKVSEYRGYLQMANPKWEAYDPEEPPGEHGERLRPVYPGSETLPSARIEAAVPA
jgi:ATP-dependent DNA helicase RecG